jgi:hypothetical protein
VQTVPKLGQPSWHIASSTVEAFVTERGGHVAPVTFDRRNRKIRPYSIAPWTAERTDPSLEPILKVLRGDFFCLPFGANATPFRGERHPIHGETANAKWTLTSLERRNGRAQLHLSLRSKIRKGRVDKFITLVDGHDAIYSRHVVSGMSGRMCFGHHAMLKFPPQPGSGIVSTSAFVYGQVFPGKFESPAQGGYTFLKPGATFDSLERVPAMTGELADLTRYPARHGWEDLVMIVNDALTPLAWVAVAFPRQRYVWFALKDPRILRNTVFWFSNAGRHYPPWNGRHRCVMGLEDVTANFHYGLAQSVRNNPLSEQGFPTSVELSASRPLTVSYIMAVAKIPAGFDRVVSIRTGPNRDCVVVRSSNGKAVRTPIDMTFLSTD